MLKNIARRAVLLMTWPVHRAIHALDAAVHPSWFSEGIRIVESLAEDLSTPEREKVKAAIGQLRDVVPWQLAHFRRYVRALVVSDFGQTGFTPILRLAVIDKAYLEHVSPIRLAAELVSMACGGRLSSYGWWQRPELRHRLNRLQFEAAIAYARRAPGGLPIVEELTADWSARGWRVASVGDGMRDLLRREGMPSWLANLVGWWLRRLDT